MTVQAGNTLNYERMPLGKVTRTYGGKSVQWIARCAKCGRRAARSVFIPEKVARRLGGSKPNVSFDHKATYQVAGHVAYWSIDDSCLVVLTSENIDDLLNIEERADYDRWTTEYETWQGHV